MVAELHRVDGPDLGTEALAAYQRNFAVDEAARRLNAAIGLQRSVPPHRNPSQE